MTSMTIDTGRSGQGRASMVQYFVFLVTGLLFLYQLLVLWGFSAGLAIPGPYCALLGGLLVFPFATATSLYLPRAASWAGLLGGVLQLVWPITGLALGFGSPVELLFFGALPTGITAFSTYRIIRTRGTPGLQRGTSAVSVLLAGLPFLLFLTVFNASAIVGFVLQGPPPWPHATVR